MTVPLLDEVVTMSEPSPALQATSVGRAASIVMRPVGMTSCQGVNRRAVDLALDGAGIETPFPRSDVRPNHVRVE